MTCASAAQRARGAGSAGCAMASPIWVLRWAKFCSGVMRMSVQAMAQPAAWRLVPHARDWTRNHAGNQPDGGRDSLQKRTGKSIGANSESSPCGNGTDIGRPNVAAFRPCVRGGRYDRESPQYVRGTLSRGQTWLYDAKMQVAAAANPCCVAFSLLALTGLA